MCAILISPVVSGDIRSIPEFKLSAERGKDAGAGEAIPTAPKLLEF